MSASSSRSPDAIDQDDDPRRGLQHGCARVTTGCGAAMDFRILGPLEVDDDHGPVALGGARQRALLAILLLRRGEVVPAERLVEDLYGGRPPATAAKSLQAHISRLRKTLADGRLVTRSRGYVLATDAEEVDADRFAALVEQGRTALQAGDAETAERQLAAALAQWRGPVLADLPYEEFAQSEIARLEESRLACLEDLAEARLALGRHAELVGDLERLVAEHPLRERPRGHLMLALYRAGRQADALAVYQDGRRALVEELGIDPGRALQDLERAILNHDPALDATVPPRAAAQTADGGGSFVGRTRELAQLEELLGQVIAGNGRFAVISGEAGMGKSRLVEELSTRARRLGIRVLPGRCWEAGGAPAFWPWVQALRSLVREAPSDALREQLGTAASDVAHLLPELRERFPDIPEVQSLESDGARFRLFDSTAAFLRRAAEGQPLLVTLDDVHAADQSSLLLIAFVSGQLGDARAAIVATFREPELEADDPVWAVLADLVRRASLRLSLRGLVEPEVAAYMAQVANEEPSQPLVEAIAAETDGNPLFVGEIVRLLATEGQLPVPSGEGWRPTIPETVREVIDRRLHRLDRSCREILAVASVIGRDFSIAVLEPLASLPRDELVSRLDEAVAARLVAHVPGSRSELRFTHALVRETLYDELRAADRRDLHRRAAEAITQAAGAPTGAHLSEIAHHYFQALPSVDPDAAVEWARRAGDHARDLLAFEEAARLYETALLAMSARSAPHAEMERRLLLALGDAYTGAADTPKAKDAYLRAAVVARESQAPGDLAAAALGYGGQLVWARPAGDRLVVPLLEEALAAVPPDEPTLRARLLARLAGALRDERDPRRRLEVGELAVEAARRADDPRALIQALLGLSVAQYSFVDHDHRLGVLRELRDLAVQTNDTAAEREALNAEILLSSALNDFATVSAHTQRLAARAEELRQPAAQWFAEAMKALLALHYGRFEDAERLLQGAYEIGRQPYPTDSRAAYIIHLYLLRREQGRADEAHDALAQIADESPARPFFRCALSSLAVDTGRTTDARRLLEELAPNRFEIVPRDNEWPLSAAFLVETIAALGDVSRAAVLYDELTPLAEGSSANPPEGTIGAIARSLGVLATLLDRQADAIAHLRRAIEIDTATGARPWVAYAQVELAAVLAREGRNEEAAALWDVARATAATLGMQRLAARVPAITRR
jgi:DNA-binding SARP family transcriptional activator